MSSRSRTSLLLLLTLFVLLRVPGLTTPYQQDEFKSAMVAEAGIQSASSFLSHPPLTALLLTAGASVFGGSHMRLLPLLFGLLSAVLLFSVARRRLGERAALFSLFLYTIAFYSAWASLMIDTDGAILPTFFLATVYSYDRAKESLGKRRLFWWLATAGALLLGLLVKLSFVLVVGALILDYLWEHRRDITSVQIGYALAGLCGFTLFTMLSFLFVHFVDPAFSFADMVLHARGYFHISGRNYTQIVVEGIKALFYLSPLLIAPLLFLTREMCVRLRIFLIYLGLGVIFYFILFDFSRGALDKYLMFTIVPLSILAGTALSQAIFPRLRSPWISFGVLGATILVVLNFLPHTLFPLYPKTAWFGSVLHGSWSFLTPFNGGSGPVGFYVSFLFIFASYAMTCIVALLGRLKPATLGGTAFLILCFGLVYNAVFIEEFAFGKINGSVSTVLTTTLEFIKGAPETGTILTYNDIGAYELSHMGQYRARFYAAPQFEKEHQTLFAEQVRVGGAFLVIGIPPLYEGFYSDFFSHCDTLFTTHSGVIPGTVYTCKPAQK